MAGEFLQALGYPTSDRMEHLLSFSRPLSAHRSWGMVLGRRAAGEKTEKRTNRSPLVLGFTKLRDRSVCATLLCAIGDIIPIFSPAIIYDK